MVTKSLRKSGGVPSSPNTAINTSSSSSSSGGSAPSSISTPVINMKLVSEVMKSMRVTKLFNDNKDTINHIDFSSDGSLLITSALDDQILIYDCCEKGEQKRKLNSKKYGVDLIHFTRNSKAQVIHTSTKTNDVIRHLNVHQNKYISYFSGHTQRVVTMSVNPSDDTFLSGSMDNTVRLWDVRSTECQGMIKLNSRKTGKRPVACFDPEGLIFAVGVDCERIELYDMRTFDKGPFSTFLLTDKNLSSVVEWGNVKFSPDGKSIAVPITSAKRENNAKKLSSATDNDACETVVYNTSVTLIDSFSGKLLQNYVTGSERIEAAEKNSSSTTNISPAPLSPMSDDPTTVHVKLHSHRQTHLNLPASSEALLSRGYLLSPSLTQLPMVEASFSPDSQFLISGSLDGSLHIWNNADVAMARPTTSSIHPQTQSNGLLSDQNKVCVLRGDHESSLSAVQFNPKYMLMASACRKVAFWVPNLDANETSNTPHHPQTTISQQMK